MYAIVDIETTGGYAAANGIIEISIQTFDGKNVVDKYETLINPNQNISRYIQAFTGITNEMVHDAPCFQQVADTIYSLLHNKIFVAHNVNFDYSFVKAHLQQYGYELNTKKLCTIRLAKQIFPGFSSYSLGNLCRSLDIEIVNRHRAGGDAAATLILLKRLLCNDTNNVVATSLSRNSKEFILPPNVPKQDYLQLPSTPGVYYFHDSKGKIVYVGKAKNIRQRVNSHFSNNSDSRQKQNFVRYIYSITYKSTATELMAAILESTEIKRWWPKFNYSQKRWEELYGIFMYEDQNGYMRLAIEKKLKNSNPVYTFHYKVDGYGVMRKIIKQYSLCPRLCFIQTDSETCSGIKEEYCKGACEKKEAPELYNQRILEAISSLTKRPSYVVLDKGLKKDELSCILVSNGSFFGMGYLPKNFDNITFNAVAEYLQPYKENSHIRTLLHSHYNNFPLQVKLLEDN